MILDFNLLTIVDFKSFRGEHIFDFASYGEGLHFIRGDNRTHDRLGANGTGKSTLLVDAICWCLTGQTPDLLKNTDVKPWHFKGTTRVGLSITRGKNKHSIVRSANPSRLMIDRKDVGQPDVDKLIGMSFDLLRHTILFPQGQPLFFDLTPRDKMQLFVDALHLDRWDDRAAAAVARVNELSQRIAGLEGEAKGLQSSIDTIDDLIIETERKADAWEDEWKQRTREAKKELKQCEAELERATRARDTADLAYEGAEVEVRHLRRDLDAKANLLTAAQAKLTAEQYAADQLNVEIRDMQRQLDGMEKGDVCSRCGQPLRGNFAKHRERLQRDIDAKQRKADDTVKSKTCNAVTVAEKALNRTRDHLAQFRKKADDAKDTLDTYDRTVGELKGRARALRDAMNTKEAEANPHRAQLRALKHQRKEAIDKLNACDDDKDDAEQKMKRAKFWTKGFKDIRLFVLEEIMQELEWATNAMLDDAGLVGWRVAYLLERETARGSISRGMTIKVRSPDSDGMVKWESWSGGEAQRLRIVGALALSEVLLNHAGVEPSMEVLDEPTQHLSTEGVADLCAYLSDRSKRLRRQIWYVDHQSVESLRFQSVTTIRRDDRGSHIVSTGVSGRR